jgi:cytochrome bd-type quinol oxidase subunit 2
VDVILSYLSVLTQTHNRDCIKLVIHIIKKARWRKTCAVLIADVGFIHTLTASLEFSNAIPGFEHDTNTNFKLMLFILNNLSLILEILYTVD